jgi:SAM-dependent methyltransferase
MHSPYDDKDAIARAVREGRHREIIGGLWDSLGRLQLDFLVAQGMQPQHRLLDIGCGSLRLGTLAVDYLMPEHYFGTDINNSLLEAGYANEISATNRLPRGHLVEDGNFDFPGIPASIDYAIACSVFTHLPLNHMRRALVRMRTAFPRLRKFCFTVFLAPSAEATADAQAQLDGIVTHDTYDPYHYTAAEIVFMTASTGYTATIVDWNHPRNQRMVVAVPVR